MKTLEDILKESRKKDLGELRGVLEEFLDAEKRAQDDRADRFVSAVEGIERIANTLLDAVNEIGHAEKIAPILEKHGELLKSIKDKPFPEPAREVSVRNLPSPVTEMGLKKPAWWKFQSNARLEGLIVGLRNDLREFLDRPAKEKEETEAPQLGAGINLMKRDKRRRSKYAVVPKEAADGTNTTFTYPDNWVAGSMRIFVGTGRLFKEAGDWKDLGNRQIQFTFAPTQTPYADYDAT